MYIVLLQLEFIENFPSSSQLSPSPPTPALLQDWLPLRELCPECGVTVKLWEAFAHRMLWNHTWVDAVAFQPRDGGRRDGVSRK